MFFVYHDLPLVRMLQSNTVKHTEKAGWTVSQTANTVIKISFLVSKEKVL